MAGIPKQPKIYHITHIDNLASLVTTGKIESDDRLHSRGGGHTVIGMTEIKRRRLYELDVTCHPGTKVGEFVPFYFCPRSIMLYIMHKATNPDLSYTGGQSPILHLQADLESVIRAASKSNVRWAFTDRNAGTRFTEFHCDPAQLGVIDWNAVRATDFREPLVKEGKQAEFLVYGYFPWRLVEKVGVINQAVAEQVETVLQGVEHKPVVKVERSWYY